MMSFMILVLGTVYLGWRVYTKKKYFTKDWVKTNEHGLQLMEKQDDEDGDNESQPQPKPSMQGARSSDIHSPDEIELSLQEDEDSDDDGSIGKKTNIRPQQQNEGESYDEEDDSNASPAQPSNLAKK